MEVFVGLMIPFIGTILGAATVFFIKDQLNKKLEKILLGFAAGVMIAASVWSLLIPSIELSIKKGQIGWLPASIGFMAGIFFLLILDMIIPHLHVESNEQEGLKSNFKKSTMLILAITLHNIPEGMAVGVSYAGIIAGNNIMTLTGALALSIGIAIQNFPEGAVVSMPLISQGLTRKKAFLYGALSGIVEPIGAIITIGITEHIISILPVILSFAAGAMMYVVIEELIPGSQSGKHSNLGTIGASLGFCVMMILDVALG